MSRWNHIIGEPIPLPDDGRDHEKTATAVCDTAHVTILGVSISSRYGKHHELDEMADMVAALPPRLRRAIDHIWCNSKQGAQYNVAMRDGKDVEAITAQIGAFMEEAAFRRSGGHNGIWIGGTTVIGPEWVDDEPECK